MSKKMRVGVLRGGPSLEYSNSLRSGTNVLNHLSKDKYQAIDIFVDRDGVWHISGVPLMPDELTRKIDVVFNALHGDFGEDGKLQNLLDNLSIPYTGPSALSAALSFKKNLTKERFSAGGYKTPRHILLPAYEPAMDGHIEAYAHKKANDVHSRLSPPWIVKPLTGGSGLGIRVVKTFPELAPAIFEVAQANLSVLIEELISGKSISAFAVEKLRDSNPYIFPLLEYENGILVCPANLPNTKREEVFNITKDLYNTIGYRHCVNMDFIVTPKNEVYVLEVNANPKLIKERGIMEMCDSVGIPFKDVLDHIVQLALLGK